MFFEDKPKLTQWIESCVNEYQVKLEAEERLKAETEKFVESTYTTSYTFYSTLLDISIRNIQIYSDYLRKAKKVRILIDNWYYDSNRDSKEKLENSIRELMIHQVNK